MLNKFKIWWLQLRYRLESSAEVSHGLGGAVGGSKIRGADWKDAKPVSGHFGRTVTEARLNALRFWVRNHGQPKVFMLCNEKSTLAFVSIDKGGLSHTFQFGQTRYGMGQEPAMGHKPVTIVDVENGCLIVDPHGDAAMLHELLKRGQDTGHSDELDVIQPNK